MMSFSRTKGLSCIMVAALALVTLVTSQARAAGISWRESVPKALSEAKRTRKPVLIDFTASWCGPCQEMKKGTFTKNAVITELRRWVSVRIDVDKQESVAAKYKVEAMPTLMILKPNGTIITKAIGYRDSAELAAWLKANYAKAKP